MEDLIKTEFKKLFPKRRKLPSVDTMRDTLKLIDLNGLASMNYGINNIAIRNHLFQNGTIDGYLIVAIDDAWLFDSTKKRCEKCLNYEIRGKQYYCHKSVVGNTVPLILDFEMYNNSCDSSNKDWKEN